MTPLWLCLLASTFLLPAAPAATVQTRDGLRLTADLPARIGVGAA